jgi:hypothetical protein
MDNYDDFFEYEDESIRLDFKGIQYPKEKHADLLKDIISFANADFEGDCLIIIGVVKNEKNEKVLQGIKKEEFIDPAIYQQLVRENVEPDINFDYFTYSYSGKDFAIFRIYGCSDKPYLMKKDYGALKQGDGWIRKGTHQPRMNRRDFDSITAKKSTFRGFHGELICHFSDSGLEETNITPLGEIILPSDMAAEKIRKLIEEREKYFETIRSQKNPPSIAQQMTPFVSPCGKFFSVNGLETDLKNVKQDYLEDDRYALFEQHGNFVNFSILNLGDRYIEDASIRVIIPNLEGLLIADKIYAPPTHSANGMRSVEPMLSDIHYPSVEYFDDFTIVGRYLGNIRHQIPLNEVFERAIRIVVLDNLEGQTIPVKCSIHGKNLQKPIEKELKMHVIKHNEPT